MRAREGWMEGGGGLSLFWRSWEAGEPRGSLLLVHGLGEHSGRYEGLARFLGEMGVSTFAFDLRGHGRSPGCRGKGIPFPILLDDLRGAEAEMAGRRACPRPRFLLGHSLGGLIVLRGLLEGGSTFQGVVLSAPWLGSPFPAWARALGRGLGRLLPRFPLPSGLGPERLTRDPEEMRAWRSDPLIHTRLSAGLFREAEKAQAEVLRALPAPGAVREGGRRFPVPALFLIADADPVVDPAVAASFARGIEGEGNRVEILRGFRHEPFHEVEREKVHRVLGSWLEERIRIVS